MSHTLAACTADFKERTRRFSFWAMVALCLFAAFLFVPNHEASFRVLVLDSDVYIQAGNPTWVPMASALCSGLLLPLLGFAFIKNAIGTDRENGVMKLLQSTRLPRLGYVTGKFLSNCGILLAWLGVLVLGAMAMAVVRFPGQWMSPWVLLSPFLALVPGLLFTSALAVFCETVPFLRSKAGSVFAILGIFVLQVMAITSVIDYTQGLRWNPMAMLDISGYQWLFGSMHTASIAATGRPIYSSTILGGGDWVQDTGTTQLVFSGLHADPVAWASTAALIMASLLLVLAAALLLERRPLAAHSRHKHRRGAASAGDGKSTVRPARLTVPWIPARSGRFSLLRILAAETGRMAKSVPMLWLLPALGLMAASCLVEPNVGTRVLLPVLYGWAILPLSAMGSEEKSSGMDALYRTISGAPVRQTAAAYAAGALFSLLLAAPAGMRLALGGEAAALAAVLAWALMIPAAGIALGGLSQSPRPFQILFIMVLYMVLNMPDTFFPTGAAALANVAIYFVIAAACLVLLFARQWRAQQ